MGPNQTLVKTERLHIFYCKEKLMLKVHLHVTVVFLAHKISRNKPHFTVLSSCSQKPHKYYNPK